MTKVLLIGDIFGRPGRRAVFTILPNLMEEEKIDFVIANGENSAGGKGLTPDICLKLFDVGVDVITNGNHFRDKKEMDSMYENEPRLIRPLNYPPTLPGSGHVIRQMRNGKNIAVVNAMGKVHLADIESPFNSTKKVVEEMKGMTPLVVVDFHAEATSEKRAMGWHLDGLASAVLGTHTHVQTADEEILPNGTAYITDVGMTGPYDSVIGLRKDLGLQRFLEGVRKGFDVGKKDVRFCGAIVELNDETGKAKSIRRVRHDLEPE